MQCSYCVDYGKSVKYIRQMHSCLLEIVLLLHQKYIILGIVLLLYQLLCLLTAIRTAFNCVFWIAAMWLQELFNIIPLNL